MKFLNNQAEFDILVSKEDKLIVIDFTATWCPPCRMIGPKFEKMADEYTDAILVKVDVDAASDVAGSCEVSAMPTFQFYKGGKKIDEVVGADEAKIRATIEKHM